MTVQGFFGLPKARTVGKRVVRLERPAGAGHAVPTRLRLLRAIEWLAQGWSPTVRPPNGGLLRGGS
ncbi:hypothetical protein [Stenotrophomonas rhizophila]|uniref:hypothetical protein n=1 Tax=Stenotrophomonas rhizophila TaxID=216778 RepID=UPI00081CA392|nr:hypothetical protein [Stenotrophomonas rhizophila]AOA70835.1 hypothetical protein BAY15_0401 [Stenotrophomonas rhizophila]